MRGRLDALYPNAIGLLANLEHDVVHKIVDTVYLPSLDPRVGVIACR